MVTMALPPSKSASGVIPLSRLDALFLFNYFIALTVSLREGGSILIGRSISAGAGEAVAMSDLLLRSRLKYSFHSLWSSFEELVERIGTISLFDFRGKMFLFPGKIINDRPDFVYFFFIFGFCQLLIPSLVIQ